MNQLKHFGILFLIVLLSLSIKVLNAAVNSGSKDNCSYEQATQVILELPSVVKADNHIKELTDNTKGIALMGDSTVIDNTSYYRFQVGFNGEDSFETYFFLYVNRANCSDVKIRNIVTGNLMSIKEWRKLNPE